MSETSTNTTYAMTWFGGFGIGVCLYIWTTGTMSIATFLWGLVYGAFWPVWLGYRIAEMLGAGT